MPVLLAETEATVARIWAAATALRPLFNGRVFCVDTVAPEELCGHWTEYRRVVAQMAEPCLFDIMRVRNLAVCGVLIGPGGVAVGRREGPPAYQAGLWQLPPAGSVDDGAAEPGGASWRAALLTELREELGIAAADVLGLRALGLVQHPTGVLDMGVRIDTGLHGPAILASHTARGNAEYDRMLVLPPQDVLAHVGSLGGQLVPSAGPFLAWAGSRG